MKPEALDTLTSLRFFAAASIVAFHMQEPILNMALYGPLALGVSFFFVLSGFILTYVYQHGFSAREFYRARVARLWPVHAATLLLALFLLLPALLIRPEWSIPGLANLLLVHAWIPVAGYVFSFNAVSWSLSAEMFFYLIFPALRGSWFGVIVAGMVAITGAALFTLDYNGVPATLTSRWTFSSLIFVMQHPVMRMLEFAVGVGFGRLFLTKRIKTTTALEVLSVVSVIAFAIASDWIKQRLFAAGAPNTGAWLSQAGGMLVFAAAIFVFAHQRGAVSRALQHRWLVLLGEISFATYMIHQIVIKLVQSHNVVDAAGRELASLLVVSATFAASFLLWYYIEKPGRQAIMQIGRRRTVTAQQAAT